MPDEGFFRRWSRLKSTRGPADTPAELPPTPPRAPLAPPEPAALGRDEAEAAPRAPLPTLEDAARLTPDADFSAFVARDVDKSVQRLALKKLFADPHFNAIDGLDMYMSDYNKASPLTPGMLASLKHAPGVLDRLLGDRREDSEAAGSAQVSGQEAAPVAVPPDAQEHATVPAHQAAPVHEHEYERRQPSMGQGNA